MSIKQISVLIENKMGSLAEVTDFLAKSNVNLRALSIADTADYGVARMIVSNPELAVACLKEIGVFVKLTDVFAVTIDDSPGGLTKSLHKITDEGIEISYMYAFVGKISGKAIMVLKVNNPEKAEDILKNSDVELLSAKDVYRI